MSHTRVKTTYSIEGPYGSTEIKTLYCDHNHSCDCKTYYDENGDVQNMAFYEWDTNNDLWDAMIKLNFPFKKEWEKELLDGVEYYSFIIKTTFKVGSFYNNSIKWEKGVFKTEEEAVKLLKKVTQNNPNSKLQVFEILEKVR